MWLLLPSLLPLCPQEDTAEHYLSSLAILNSHFNYFKLKDVAFFILKCLSGKNPLISYTGPLPHNLDASWLATQLASHPLASWPSG